MSLCIFVPSIFALALLLFPKGSEEYMRWFTLLGTAVTMVLSIVLFIDYLAHARHIIRSDPRKSRTACSVQTRGKAARDADGFRRSAHEQGPGRPLPMDPATSTSNISSASTASACR